LPYTPPPSCHPLPLPLPQRGGVGEGRGVASYFGVGDGGKGKVAFIMGFFPQPKATWRGVRQLSPSG